MVTKKEKPSKHCNDRVYASNVVAKYRIIIKAKSFFIRNHTFGCCTLFCFYMLLAY